MRDFKNLSREQAAAWEKALDLFIACLRRGSFDPSLRVKRVQGYPGVWEMTWAPNGRATFEYGDELRAGEPHIIWRASRSLSPLGFLSFVPPGRKLGDLLS